MNERTGTEFRQSGLLGDGARYLISVPPEWKGTLLLYSHGPPTPPDGPAWPEALPLVRELLTRGYAIAGCGTDVFYPLEENLPNQIEVLDMFDALVGHPDRTIAWGESMGGLMTAALVQTSPDRFAGALALCGPLAGGISHWNQDLDCSYAIKTLLAPDSDLELVSISRPPANLEAALRVLRAAQQQPEGRARIALAAALRQVPGWTDPVAPQPAGDDVALREEAQYRWLDGIVLLVALSARRVLEDRAGGNPSWNTGVDYRELLGMSQEADTVSALYRTAGLDLDRDLDVLANSPRIRANQAAVDYFSRFIAFDGNLSGTPVLTIHTRGDGLVPVEHEHAYADVVAAAGQSESLRQLFVERAGHCSYTPAEALTGLTALEARIDSGAWPELAIGRINAEAAALGAAANSIPPAMVVDLDRTGQPAPASFVNFTPGPFSRPFDARSLS